MSNATTLDRFSIVVVPFPYADQLAEKRRPALVISSREFHERTGLVWVAMITSAKNAPWPDDIRIADHGACGLPAQSLIRAVKIATIDVNRIAGYLGKLTLTECDHVAAFYAQCFA